MTTAALAVPSTPHEEIGSPLSGPALAELGVAQAVEPGSVVVGGGGGGGGGGGVHADPMMTAASTPAGSSVRDLRMVGRSSGQVRAPVPPVRREW